MMFQPMGFLPMEAGKCSTEGLEACRNSSAYYIGRISGKQAYAVLLHMYTAMYGGRMLNAAPLPVLPMVIACVCTPAAAIATE